MNPYAVDKHGLRLDQLRDAPRSDEVASHVRHLLSERIFVGHNATTDLRFTAAEMAPALSGSWPVLDTLSFLKLNQIVMPGGYSLDNICNVLRIASGSHTALGDAMATSELLRWLLGERGDEIWAKTRKPDRMEGDATPPRVLSRALLADPVAERHQKADPLFSDYTEQEKDDLYLGALHAALADGKISESERQLLDAQARDFGLGAADLRSLERAYLRGLSDAAWLDGVLDAAEYLQITGVAEELAVDDHDVLSALGPPAS